MEARTIRFVKPYQFFAIGDTMTPQDCDSPEVMRLLVENGKAVYIEDEQPKPSMAQRAVQAVTKGTRR